MKSKKLVNGQIIKSVGHTKSLGVTEDTQLTRRKHVKEISKAAVYLAKGAFKRVQPFIPKETATQIWFNFAKIWLL